MGDYAVPNQAIGYPSEIPLLSNVFCIGNESDFEYCSKVIKEDGVYCESDILVELDCIGLKTRINSTL